MRSYSIATVAAACLTAPSLAGATFSFTADIYGATAIDGPISAGHGTHTVLDLYLSNQHSQDLRLLSLYDVNVSLGEGAFVHDDADTVGGGTGNWSAVYNTLGGDVNLDSFVTLGAMSGGDPFAASLDPNFDGSIAESISADAGWYNNDPTNDQGNVASLDRIFVGRFVVSNTLPAGTTFSVSSTFSYNFQSPGVYFDGDSQVFTLPAVVPGPLALVAFAGVGLAGRGRRR